MASAQTVWVVLGDLRQWWVIMLDLRVTLASAKAVWVVLEGLGCWLVVMLDLRTI